MTDLASEKVMDGVPEDYPGQVVVFPEHVSHLICAMYGVQSKDPKEARQWADVLITNLGHLDNKTAHLERGRFVDDLGYHTEIIMGYFLGKDIYDGVTGAEGFQSWWRSLPNAADSDLGFFKEVAHCPKNYYEYATGGTDKVASAALLELEGSDKFGYWGAYRDRVPASAYDKFVPALDKMPDERNDATKGRRLTVTTPNNMCVIREGQGHANTGAEERAAWASNMHDKVDRWIKYLGDDPATTGCISIRPCEEYDVKTGETNERFCQNAYLISLAHIERAAKTVCEHVELRQSFVDMMVEEKFTPQVHLYVEVQILQSEDMEIEYVNCHSKTGFLRFFEGRDTT